MDSPSAKLQTRKNQHQPNSPLDRASDRLGKAALMILAVLLTSACSVFGVESVEEAPYQVISKAGKFEVREYEPLVVVETLVDASYKSAGNQAFRKLFRYISGNNTTNTSIAMTAPVISDENQPSQSSDNSESEKIAMTAPVIYDKAGESWRYQFVLPIGFTIDNAPMPLDPEVKLAVVPKQRVATLRYSGRLTAKAGAQNAQALQVWMESEGLVPSSAPRWAGYNAPWTLPPFRRNEVLINIGEL